MNNRTEQVAIIIGAVVGLMMAAAGWIAYDLSGAEVLLLDGNFSFIGVIATLLALFISVIKTRPSKTYPFGQFVYEPAYSLSVGLLTVGVIVVAVAGNATKIVDYSQGARFPAIDTSVILVYTIVMVVLCFGLAGVFAFSNRRLKGRSTILGAYTVQSTIDGLLSAGAGGALIGFGFVPEAGSFGFLTQIGDAIMVVLLCVLVMYQPVKLIRDSFIEVSGGALNDPRATEKIRSVASTHISDMETVDLFISKTGSSYLVVAFMSANFLGANNPHDLVRLKGEIKRDLEKEFGHVAFELALADDSSLSDANASLRRQQKDLPP